MVVAAAAAAAVAISYIDAKMGLGRDLGRLSQLIRTKRALAMTHARDENSLYYYFEEQVRKSSDREAYRCEDVSLTWREVELQSRQFAHFLLAQGMQKGEVVALYMPNKPMYPVIWIACLSLNIIPAFINFNLTGKALIHCIKTVNSKLVIFDASLSEPINEIVSALDLAPVLVRWTDSFSPSSEKDISPPHAITLDPATLSAFPAERFSNEHRNGIRWLDPAVLIFTSGTTGLPKAASMNHGRASMAMHMWALGHSFNDKTRIYTPMPIYHSTAAVLAVAMSWVSGSTVIIGRKFSATKFWDEVRATDANVIQYVGEVLRYLLSVPPSPLDRQHHVRLAYGNGCRPDVWNRFRERFGVDTIAEFFTATEANVSLFNYNANNLGAGAVGHGGWLAKVVLRKEQALLQVDPLTEEPARTPDGLCIRAALDEPGELVSRIVADSPHQSFAGYYQATSATQKKILHDVFEKGDSFFRTGDLLRSDADGYTWFADRLGDTFRWRSENVSTTEVQHALAAVVHESNVYGVLVPSHDGRAGCVAVAQDANVDLKLLARQVISSLPKYAQPLFVRLVKSQVLNGTQKQLKGPLRNEGVNPTLVKDPVYWLQKDSYVPFTTKDWEGLQNGKVKL